MTAALTVIGDTVLDRDIGGTVSRVCPDAPAPVLDVDSEDARPGGAGLAAVLARGLGARVTLVTALGDDAAGELTHSLLTAAGVDVVNVGGRGSTVEKIRVRSGSASLVRFDRGRGVRPAGCPAALHDALADAAAVLVSDYGGAMARLPQLRDALATAAMTRPLVWDPHPRGPKPVAGVHVITPTVRELDALRAADDSGSGLARVTRAAEALARDIHCRAVAVTMGSRGALLVRAGDVPLAIPARPSSAVDTVGAGDCFAATVADRLARGALVPEAVEAAVSEATSFVDGGGVAGLGRDPDATPPPGETAAEVAQRVRARGGVVVATGGCFDLLHAGHVATLNAARALGDGLIVLLNSDASVRRLKGPDRPRQSQADREAVLRALACVDAVQIFDTDTPVPALEDLRPDVFAKGGDYTASGLAEAELLTGWGGQTVILPYLAGRSTTRLLQEVRADHGR